MAMIDEKIRSIVRVDWKEIRRHLQQFACDDEYERYRILIL